MTLMPGSGYCYSCNNPIDDSCGGETRLCRTCRSFALPDGWSA